MTCKMGEEYFTKGRVVSKTNIEWARGIRDQCVDADVPFYFKQWCGVYKKAAGRVLDGREWDEMPDRIGRKRRRAMTHPAS